MLTLIVHFYFPLNVHIYFIIYNNQILYKIYVENKTLKESAREMQRSYNYVLNVHKKALAAFEEANENLRFLI